MVKKLFEIITTSNFDTDGNLMSHVINGPCNIWAETFEQATAAFEKYVDNINSYKCQELVMYRGCLVYRKQAESLRESMGGQIGMPIGVEGVNISRPFSWS